MEVKTYRRKIQITGRTTYTVSLPKDWVNRNKLEKGSEVMILDRGDRLEVVLAKPMKFCTEPKLNKVTLEVTPDEISSIERLLIAYYEAGYDIIEIVQNPVLSEELRNSMRRILLRLSGLEVVEEAANHMILQSIVDASYIPISRTLDRMETLVGSMLDDLTRYFELTDKEILNSIVERDNELDKFYFFLSKQIALAIKREEILERIGIEDPVLTITYKSYGKCLEEMGDAIVSMARYLLKACNSVDQHIVKLIELMRKGFLYSVKAFRESSEESGKAVSNLYTSFFMSFSEESRYYGDVIVLLVGKFLSLCVDVIEAYIERAALLSVCKRKV
ncbi:MAG: hypothetical protein DRJ49_05775 [Thermoprotei archaeon]|nr:MAG: hypothetical protein DRN53_02400 [Thermoprotei archaeon]RLE87911.1 MAG: hypothetical protein DRJ49_05775 [Thermoprotei archaeon]